MGFGEQRNIGKISKGTLANCWEQGNKIRKITVRKHSERVWEHRAILEGNKDPPWETLRTEVRLHWKCLKSRTCFGLQGTTQCAYLSANCFLRHRKT